MPAKLSKMRCDSWAADLTQEQQWDLYAKFRRWNWKRVADFARDEYGIDPPSRSRLYAWFKQMAKMESAHRIENAVLAQAQTGEIAAARNIKDPTLIDAWKTFATEQALNGNVDQAMKFTNMALAIAAQQTKQKELELKAAAQETKDDALQLAREKFMYDAAKAALKHAVTIKGIFQDNNLDNDAKILATRKALFGDDVPL